MKKPRWLKPISAKQKARLIPIIDLVIQGLIIFSLITFSLETLPNLDTRTQLFLLYSEIITVMIFTVEYLVRLLVSDRKLKFIFSFFGLVDLFAILPFYLSTSIDLRSVRVLRLLRLLRVVKIFLYWKSIQRFQRAFVIAREEILLFLFVTLLLLFLAAVGIYYCEHEAQPEKFASVFHSLWWAVCTLTTVGYGDVYPVTVGGKIFTFFVLFTGIGVISVPTGLLASALAQVRAMEVEENLWDKEHVTQGLQGKDHPANDTPDQDNYPLRE